MAETNIQPLSAAQRDILKMSSGALGFQPVALHPANHDMPLWVLIPFIGPRMYRKAMKRLLDDGLIQEHNPTGGRHPTYYATDAGMEVLTA